MKSFEDVCVFLRETKEEIEKLEKTISASENYLKYGNAEEIARFKARGKALEANDQHLKTSQQDCTHLKGGPVFKLGRDGKVEWLRPYYKGGDAAEYAVIKHKFFWGDVWVACLRCGKKWKPGDPDYEKALAFPTKNTTSESLQMNVDVAAARELTKES